MLLDRGGVRLRKDHHPAGNHGIPQGPGRRGGDWRAEQQAGRRRPDQGCHAQGTADGVPGSHRGPGPALHRLRGPGRADGEPGPAQAGHPEADHGTHGARGPAGRPRQPLPQPVLRRSAPAHRHCPRPRREPPAGGPGRTRLRPGRLGAGRRHQPPGLTPCRTRPELPHGGARPLRGPAHLQPRGGHVPGQDRGNRRRRRRVRQPPPPLHPGPALRDPGAGPGTGAHPRTDHPPGRPALSAGGADRLQLRHPLSRVRGAAAGQAGEMPDPGTGPGSRPPPTSSSPASTRTANWTRTCWLSTKTTEPHQHTTRDHPSSTLA